MDWFRHDANANLDDKLQEILLDYGLEGYGLYWYCVELIVGKVSADNITFELKHDARVIARNTGSTVQKVEEMMRRFVELGLFENQDGSITCMKVAKRLMSSATSNPVMRNIIANINKNNVIELASCHRHDDVMKDKTRLDKIRTDKNNNKVDLPHAEAVIKKTNLAKIVFDEWALIMNHPKAIMDAKRKRAIDARLKDGYTIDQLKQAILGCKHSEFHQGANDRHQVYDDIESISRTASNVDKFIQMGTKSNKLSAAGQSTQAALERWLGETND